MHKLVRVCGCALLSVMLAAHLWAAGSTNELGELTTSYTADRARLLGFYDQQCGQAQVAYRQAIETQMQTAKKSGDLDTYLVFEDELKRLKTDKTILTNNINPTLEGPVALYQKTLREAALGHEKAKACALRQYIARLTPLMQNLTRSDRLDDAKLVREVVNEAKAELTFIEIDLPPEPVKTPTPPPAQPPSPATLAEAAANEVIKNLMGTWSLTWREKRSPALGKVVIDANGKLFDVGRTTESTPIGTWEVRSRQCLLHLPAVEITLSITSNKKSMLGHGKQGAALTAIKIAEWTPAEEPEPAAFSPEHKPRENPRR
jgi:hypothetical protein